MIGSTSLVHERAVEQRGDVSASSQDTRSQVAEHVDKLADQNLIEDGLDDSHRGESNGVRSAQRLRVHGSEEPRSDGKGALDRRLGPTGWGALVDQTGELVIVDVQPRGGCQCRTGRVDGMEAFVHHAHPSLPESSVAALKVLSSGARQQDGHSVTDDRWDIDQHRAFRTPLPQAQVAAQGCEQPPDISRPQLGAPAPIEDVELVRLGGEGDGVVHPGRELVHGRRAQRMEQRVAVSGSGPDADGEVVREDLERGRPDQALDVGPSRGWRIGEETARSAWGWHRDRSVQQSGMSEPADEVHELLLHGLPRCPKDSSSVLRELVHVHGAVEEGQQGGADRIDVVQRCTDGIEQQQLALDLVHRNVSTKPRTLGCGVARHAATLSKTGTLSRWFGPRDRGR